MELDLKWPGSSQCLKLFGVVIYIDATLGEARRTRHRWPLGDEGKQAKKIWGGSGPLPYLLSFIKINGHLRKGNLARIERTPQIFFSRENAHVVSD